MSTFSQIMQKVITGEKLSPTEVEEARLLFERTEQANNDVNSWKSGFGDIVAENIKAEKISAGKNTLTGVAARFSATTSVANATFVDVSSWTEVYNDGFEVSSGEIKIPLTGIYQILLSASYGAATPAGVAYAEVTAKLNGVATFPSANGAIVPTFPLPYLTGVREALYQKNDLIKVRMYQGSGSTVNCYSAITFRMVRLTE